MEQIYFMAHWLCFSVRKSRLIKSGIVNRCCHLVNYKLSFMSVGSNCMFCWEFDSQNFPGGSGSPSNKCVCDSSAPLNSLRGARLWQTDDRQKDHATEKWIAIAAIPCRCFNYIRINAYYQKYFILFSTYRIVNIFAALLYVNKWFSPCYKWGEP